LIPKKFPTTKKNFPTTKKKLSNHQKKLSNHLKKLFILKITDINQQKKNPQFKLNLNYFKEKNKNFEKK